MCKLPPNLPFISTDVKWQNWDYYCTVISSMILPKEQAKEMFPSDQNTRD